jgi:hypothetical protein
LSSLQESQADVARVEGIQEAAEDVVDEKPRGPPPATVARRAKSYSDFYDVVRAHLKRERVVERKKSRETIGNELEFVQWYGGVHDELLDASHDEYKYVGGLTVVVSCADGTDSTRTSCI